VRVGVLPSQHNEAALSRDHAPRYNSDGGVAEWLNAADLKSAVPLRYRGFESHRLRHGRGERRSIREPLALRPRLPRTRSA
jgi:hypothetical protein